TCGSGRQEVQCCKRAGDGWPPARRLCLGRLPPSATSSKARRGRHRLMSTRWLSAREVEQRFGFKPSTLCHWRKSGCPALGGKKPRSKRGVGLHRLYHPGDLAKARATRPTDEWIPAGAAEQRFGLSRTRLWLWRQAGCLFLGGRKPKARQILTPT